MAITITPAQAAQAAVYTERERHIRQLLANGLKLQLKAIEARVQLEAQLVADGELEEMAAYYTTQYARLGSEAQDAFDAIEARIVANHQLMWRMHSALKAIEPDTDLFPGIVEPSPSE